MRARARYCALWKKNWIGNSISRIDDAILADKERAHARLFEIAIRFLVLLLKVNSRRETNRFSRDANSGKFERKEKEKHAERKREREGSHPSARFVAADRCRSLTEVSLPARRERGV
jgi:hypothetical protein